MPNESVKVRATVSVANVSCGFDCIGDTLTILLTNNPGIELSISGLKSNSILTVAEKNTAGKAILSLLNTIDIQQGFREKIEKGIPPARGIGSIAASAAAAIIR